MSDRSIRKFPAADVRVESGPIQFGEDWPGTFIRGDHAAGYALHLQEMLNAGFPINAISLAVLKGLLSALQASNLDNEKSSPLVGNEADVNYATHRPRYSDSSLYDEVCQDCGAKDYAIGTDELSQRACPGPSGPGIDAPYLSDYDK